MITVLEGPDLAGKSTLARWLAQAHSNCEILKAGQPSAIVDILEQYLRPIQDWCYEPMDRRPNMIVLDRWHVGETIYGPLLRGQSRLTAQQLDYVDMVLQTFGCNFLYVHTDVSVLERRWDERGDDLIKREWLKSITTAYDHIMWQRPHWVSVVPRWTDVYAATPCPASPMAGPYIGPAKPKVLLLGDERNDDRFIFPFVPARATSGHWLMGALHAAQVPHMAVGIMNACERTDEELLTQYAALGQPPVITLGRNAEKAWRHAVGGAHGYRTAAHYLHHPQYERRFHYLEMERYGQKIKDVMENG